MPVQPAIFSSTSGRGRQAKALALGARSSRSVTCRPDHFIAGSSKGGFLSLKQRDRGASPRPATISTSWPRMQSRSSALAFNQVLAGASPAAVTVFFRCARCCNRSEPLLQSGRRGAIPRRATDFVSTSLLSSKVERPADNRQTPARYRQKRPIFCLCASAATGPVS